MIYIIQILPIIAGYSLVHFSWSFLLFTYKYQQVIAIKNVLQNPTHFLTFNAFPKYPKLVCIQAWVVHHTLQYVVQHCYGWS